MRQRPAALTAALTTCATGRTADAATVTPTRRAAAFAFRSAVAQPSQSKAVAPDAARASGRGVPFALRLW